MLLNLVTQLNEPASCFFQLGSERIRCEFYRISVNAEFLGPADISREHNEACALMLNHEVDHLIILKETKINLSDSSRLEVIELSLLAV